MKEARERVAREQLSDAYDEFCGKANCDACDHLAREEFARLRALQKQAMETLAEYMRGHAGGTDSAIAALLDGPAPEKGE